MNLSKFNPLEQRLITHIDQYGPITFEAFMEAALYDDDHGYYPARRRESGATPVGTDGDYFTSPVTHPGFGALLALQLNEMWNRVGSPSEFFVVEIGAGDGVLKSDITEFVELELPQFFKAIRYVAADLVPPHDSDMVGGNADLPIGVTGCVISNELLDALPVNRFTVQNGSVKEIFVGFEGGNFVEIVGDVVNAEVEAIVDPFLRSLPEGYRGEVNLRLGYWSDSVSATLEHGYVITIDYGFDRPNLYTRTRVDGSLRCYFQHTLGQNPLQRIGKQDITAHVDFTTVDHTLAVNSFGKVGFRSQSEFLRNVGIEDFLVDISARSGEREFSRSETEENMAGIGALMDPEGLGSFRVAVHSRGIDGSSINASELTGLSGGRSLASGYSTPTLGRAKANHARLLRAANPFKQPSDQTEKMPTWEQLFSDDL